MKQLIIAFILIPFIGISQDYVAGSRLIQLYSSYQITELIDTSQIDYRQLSENLNVFELQFASEIEASKWVKSIDSKAIANIQKNRQLKKRAVPNDADYTSQWQHNVTALNSPIIGTNLNGDIGSEAAWDITTGGELPGTNHDIVVCVLDDGVAENHPDLVANLWVNDAEIPNNGIDDDANGYTDDYKGWNTYTNSDEINDNSTAYGAHGTKVAGMIGAVGNNNIGVAGVNHQVKLMIVVAEGSEADAIAGYDYPLTLRKRFNETLGQEGALVVATNASWGVDFGKPSDAPIWCALYDSLGKVGILNSAATANLNTNVDEAGDLPTACPSDFLISVTNSNALGDKVNFAGYGQTTIDLSAPGEDVYTTTINNYGTDSGTSFASPMVAGAVGLLYSYLCSDLVTLMATAPDEVALYIKQSILNGTKTQANQNGLTQTGGSLYLPDALANVDQICWEVTSVSEVINESAKLVVFPNPATSQLVVEAPSKGHLSLVDLSGRIHISTFVAKARNLSLDVSLLKAGVYFLSFKSDEHNSVQKVVIK